MARVCMRPGCERDATACLSYDTIRCQVWLDALPLQPGRVQEICDLHSQRLTVPRGWILCDRRSPEPALFVAEPEGSPATTVPLAARRSRPAGRPGRRRSAPAAHVREEEPAPELFAAGDDEPGEPEEPEEVEPELEPSRPEPSSPLLARAFGLSGPQHSVLTQGERRPRRQ